MMARARLTSGATSLSRSSHLPPIDGSWLAKPVMLPPGRAKLSTKPLPTGSPTPLNTIGTPPAIGLSVSSARFVNSHHHVRRPRHQLGGPDAHLLRLVMPPLHFDDEVAALPPAKLIEPIEERGKPTA